MGGFLGGLGGLAGAITGLGPTIETLGQGLQINDIAKMQNARNAAAQKLVEGLPDEYAPLRQAGQASGDWIWAMGLVGGTEGEVLRQQHSQQTIKDLMAHNPGMSFQEAAAQAAAAEGDWDTFAKISAEAAKGTKGGTLDDKRSLLASRLNSTPPELHDDIRKFLDDPDGTDYEATNLTARLKAYDDKRFNVTTKPYEATIGGKTYKGEEEVHEEEMPGDYSSESAPPGGEAPAAVGSGAPVGAPPPASAAGGVPPPPPAPPPAVGDPAAPPTITGLPPGHRVIGLHEVPGPAAAQQTLIQKNLQIMGPTALDVQNRVLALGDGDVAKAQQVFDNSIGSRGVNQFLKRYPGKLGDAMLAIQTFNDRQPNALRSSQSLPLSRYGMAHQEKPIGAATDFWSLMRVLQDTRDTVSQSLEMNGWTPNPAFARVQSPAELRAKVAAAGGGGSTSSAPLTDIHGRKMRFVPGP